MVVKMLRVHFCFVGPPCHDPDGPLDGTKTCSRYGNTYFCQVHCPSDSVMYKAQALYWQCNGGVWQPTDTIPDCVGKTRAQFSLLITYISFEVSSGGLVFHQWPSLYSAHFFCPGGRSLHYFFFFFLIGG